MQLQNWWGVCYPPPLLPPISLHNPPPLFATNAPTPANQKLGKKALILDPAVSGPLTLLDARLSELLSEHGVAK
jgi:hypothetical protein